MLELRRLTKTYASGEEVLTGIDLTLGDGMFGLLGRNGAGKTTLLSILVLAIEPTSGTRLYDGADPARPAERAKIRSSIGYLPQDFAPIHSLTGFEYLVHCARLRRPSLARKEIDRRARQLLEAVDLQDAAHRASGEYSGGMRRRLGIAQALIHSPSLLVIDEPTAGLDPEERIRFRNLIAEISDHVAVLLSTHICEDIEATCDRVGVLTRGRIVFDGQPAELFARHGASTLEEAYARELTRAGEAAA